MKKEITFIKIQEDYDGYSINRILLTRSENRMSNKGI